MEVLKIKEEINLLLSEIELDETVPKNIKTRIQLATSSLQEGKYDLQFRINKALQELDDLSEDSNIPNYIRTQIWSIASILESVK